MRTSIVGILGTLLFSISFPAMVFANEQTTTIDSIMVWDGLKDDGTFATTGWVYVVPHDPMPAPLACATNGAYYSFALNRPNAKEYLASLLAAKTAGSRVFLRGLGWCKDQANSETLVYFYVYQ